MISRGHFFMLFNEMCNLFNSGKKIGGKTAYGFKKNIDYMKSEIDAIKTFGKEIKYDEYEIKMKAIIDNKEKPEEEKILELKSLQDEHKSVIEQFNKFINEEIKFEFYKIKVSDFEEYLKEHVDTGKNFAFWEPLLTDNF